MLTLTPLPNIPLIEKGDNLAEIILQNTDFPLEDGDIFVLAQKIVSKTEGRLINLADVEPSPRAFELASLTQKDARVIELILQESNEIVRTRPGLIIAEHKNGFVCANAGIDHSNIEGKDDDHALLLPEDADRSARELRDALEKTTQKKLGILIIDSHGRAWRNGIVGITIGVAGIPAIVDKRGDVDLFGRELRVTQIGAADELAAAASLMMGQANEGKPIVHVRGFPYPLKESSLDELIRSKEKDLFR